MAYAKKPLFGSGNARSYKAGSIILFQGEAPQYALQLKNGVVRVYSISPQGDEQIVLFHIASEVFPLNWLFGKTNVATFFYEALTDCTVVPVDRSALLDTFNSHENAMVMLDYLATSYSASLIRINGLQQHMARDKLIYTLYYLCQSYGRGRTLSRKVLIPIPLTHSHFAGMLGITRETVAIELGKLKKQKVISYRLKNYMVDRDKLFDLIGEDSFANLELYQDTTMTLGKYSARHTGTPDGIHPLNFSFFDATRLLLWFF